MKQLLTTITAYCLRPASCAIGVFILLNPLLSQADVDQATARKLSASGQILPLETILKKVSTIKPGKILETELESKQGAYIYEVELLDDAGTVWEIKLDAATGTLVKQEED